MKQKLLIVEDEEFLLNLLATCLVNEDYDIATATSGEEMFKVLNKDKIDLVVLDLTLPDEDGLVLARQVRARSTVPIIILTSRDEQTDRLTALDIGADDYLTKPCDMKELSLRIRNLLARSSGGQKEPLFTFNGWTLNIDGGTLVSPEGEDVILQRAEFTLLSTLVRASNRVLSRGFLIDAVSRGVDPPSDRMIDVLISRLRKRIEPDPKTPQLILTVPGRGYKFNSQVS